MSHTMQWKLSLWVCGVAGLVLTAGLCAAQPSEARALRIALVADPHASVEAQHADYGAHFEAVIAEVNAADVDAVFVAGDLANHGRPEEFERYNQLVGTFARPVFHVPGNHDVGNKVMPDKSTSLSDRRLDAYERQVGRLFYSEPVAPGVRVVGVTSSLMGSGLEHEAAQWRFLEEHLPARGDERVILLMHYPLYVEQPDEPGKYFNLEPQPRQRLLDLVRRHGVKLILTGHLHHPMDLELDGIRMIGAPPVSFGLPRDKQPEGWTLVTLEPDGSVTAELRYLPDEPAAAAATEANEAAGELRPDLAAFGPLAVLPNSDSTNHVLSWLRSVGATGQLVFLTPEQLVDAEFFNAQKFKVCLYLGGEQYRRTVHEIGDGDEALARYLEAGGVLMTLATGPYPFYADVADNPVTRAANVGMLLLGNEEAEGTAAGFDEVPAEVESFNFRVEANFAGDRLPEALAFPDSGDRRWRPLIRLRPNQPYEPWISLVDQAGRSWGEAAAWLIKTDWQNRALGRTAYASYLLTQRHPQRDAVIEALFAAVAGKLQTPMPQHVVAPSEPAEAIGPYEPPPPQTISDRVHIFYYNWYGAPPHERQYVHWPQGGFTPPQDIGANYYPQLGAYSSSDPVVLAQHVQWLRQAGVGVVCVTWWGVDSYEDQRIAPLLDAAAEAGLKVNFHLEPYEGRTPQRTIDDIHYIHERYGSHPAFYTAAQLDSRAMYYIFLPHRHPAEQWAAAIASLRGTAADGLLIAHSTDLSFIEQAGFDGGYNYDVRSQFFEDQDVHRRWIHELLPQFRAAGKLFIPSVGPGYWDPRARPDTEPEPPAAITRDDGVGSTYEQAWRAAAVGGAYFISITSFNEWHEGSQIEPTVEHTGSDGYHYPPFAQGPEQYLDQTARLVHWFVHQPIPLPPSKSQP